MNPHRMRRNSGFTLIEVVVSLTIFSFIMVAVVAGLRTIARSQGSLETVIERSEEIRLVSGFVRSTLEAGIKTQASHSGGIVVGAGTPKIDLGNRFLRGGEDWIELNTTMVVGAGFGGNYRVRLWANEDQLTLQWQPPPLDENNISWDEAPSHEITDGLQEIKLRYLGVGEIDWQPEWTEKNTLPAMVGVTLQIRDRYWPEIVVNLL